MTGSPDTTVRRHVLVPVPPAEAFEAFTTRLGSFKPPEHNLLGVPIAETVVEPWVDGSIIDRAEDGSECRWATILRFDPPSRLTFAWLIGPTWQLETDAASASEVDVRFLEDGSSGTRLELEHRHLERHGPGWEQLGPALGGEGGWPLYLDRFRELIEED